MTNFKLKNLFLTVIAVAVLCNSSKAQNIFPAFSKDILLFKQQDSLKFPPKNAILFVGSSSFTRWKNISDYFPGYSIINRGFGGSGLIDVIRYAYDIIIPYQPKQIIIYCGENDLAQSNDVQPGDIVKRFKTLYYILRTNLPDATIDYVSMKPSPLRKNLIPKMKEANRQIQVFLKKEKNAGYINVYPSLLDEKGNLRGDLFVEDKLHINEKGYGLWQKIILPYLVR